MLLPLLIVTAILIGGISFAAMLLGWERSSKKSVQPSISPNQEVSLFSLVLFLLFPTESALSESENLADEGRY